MRWKRREAIKAVLMSRLLLGTTRAQSPWGPWRETVPLRGEGTGVLSP